MWHPSSSKAFWKKNNVKEVEPNGMPKTLLPSKKVQKSTREEKPMCRLEKD
jgi:hypothetical protein